LHGLVSPYLWILLKIYLIHFPRNDPKNIPLLRSIFHSFFTYQKEKNQQKRNIQLNKKTLHFAARFFLEMEDFQPRHNGWQILKAFGNKLS